MLHCPQRNIAGWRAALSEFSLEPATQNRLLAETIEAFTTARLLTSNTIAGVPTVEVSHEALIREWARLSDWLREAREDIRFQQSLSEDVAEWKQRDKPRDRLYRGSQLKEAQAWVRRNMPSRNEVAFLRASARWRTRSQVSVLAILLLLVVTVGVAVKLLLLVLSAPNPTYVTNLSDQGEGTLRRAIDVASPGSIITFAPTLRGTIVLASNDLDISKDLIIRGPGAGTLAISNGNTGYSIHVHSGVSVSISGLAFKNNETLQNSFIDNTGELTLTNSLITNSVGPNGSINNTGTLTIMNSTISNNTAQAEGGGIFNTSSFDFTQNLLEITNSTISANKALNEGGGIDSPGGLLLTNSTVSDNTALTHGGGIAVSSLFYTIDYCTIYGNTATQDGGGIATYQHRPKVPFQNDHGNGIGESIVAGNHAHTSPNISGVIRSHGYNLFQHISPSTKFVPLNMQSPDFEVPTSAFLGIDSILRKNGGQTPTHALIPGSPAIDSIPPDTCQLIGIITDQRGVERPQGHGCDIGAYEYNSSP